MIDVFLKFFFLGWFSFGGPAAHIGYFKTTFVDKLNWLSEQEYAQLVALSQFLPGPGSSQVGYAIGYQRAGVFGGIAAFVGFTLPSAILILSVAALSHTLMGSPVFNGVIHGLKLMAVVVVADATFGMYKSFCASKLTSALCVLTALTLLIIPGIYSQIAVLVVAALIGVKFLSQNKSHPAQTIRVSWLPLFLFVALLVGLPLIAGLHPGIAAFSNFYQAGSLVFGGGHVVLPLLQSLLAEQISHDVFLTGYAAAQAVPGPMFTFATYLGYELMPNAPLIGAGLATTAVFLPGFLLVTGVMKNWQQLAQKPRIAGAMSGVNAAVVGLLLSALYQPV